MIQSETETNFQLQAAPVAACDALPWLGANNRPIQMRPTDLLPFRDLNPTSTPMPLICGNRLNLTLP